jgi:hypothetical protein
MLLVRRLPSATTHQTYQESWRWVAHKCSPMTSDRKSRDTEDSDAQGT